MKNGPKNIASQEQSATCQKRAEGAMDEAYTPTK